MKRSNTRDISSFFTKKPITENASQAQVSEPEVPNMDANYLVPGRRMYRGKSPQITNSHHFRVQVFFSVTDLQLQELENRFPELVLILPATASVERLFSGMTQYMGKKKKSKNKKNGEKEDAPVMNYSPTKEFGDAPVNPPVKELGFSCRDYGDFPTEPSRYGFFSITEGCAGKKEDVFEVKEILTVNPKKKFILLIESYAMNLTEFLAGCPISERKFHRYRSVVEYPTDIVKSVIQGIVTAVCNLIKSTKHHNYLLNTDNLVLQFEEHEPYSRYVCDRATKKYDMFQDIVDAGYDVPPRVHVRLVHVKEEENKMDDLEALQKLIFNVILQVDDSNPSLPSEWLHLYDLLFQTPVNYELISCHTCMWHTNKRLKFYRSVNDLYYKSSDIIHDKVHRLLKSLRILKTDWLSLVDGDYVLMKIRDRPKNPYVYFHVSSLITYLRNVVEHADEVAKTLSIADEGSLYSDLRYLEYRLDILFPNLIIELHSSLLSSGYVYQ